MSRKALETAPQMAKAGYDKRNWAQYSQWIAVIMSEGMSKLGMTQRMLAERMNCTQQYVSKVLKGQENLSLETLAKIESCLQLSILNHLA